MHVNDTVAICYMPRRVGYLSSGKTCGNITRPLGEVGLVGGKMAKPKEANSQHSLQFWFAACISLSTCDTRDRDDGRGTEQRGKDGRRSPEVTLKD